MTGSAGCQSPTSNSVGPDSSSPRQSDNLNSDLCPGSPLSSLACPPSLLNFSHVNVNSITSDCRLDELSQHAQSHNIDVLCVTETKLDVNVHSSLYSLDHFHAPFTKHRDRHGGGVAIYVKGNLSAKREPSLEIGDFESVWCKISTRSCSVLVCCAYIPPHISAQQFSDLIDSLSESIALAKALPHSQIILMGDFNLGNSYLLPTYTNHSPITGLEMQLESELRSLQLTQLITEPTRIDQVSGVANLRDLAIVSEPSTVANSGTLPSFSNIDHFPIYVSLNFIQTPDSYHKREFWDYSRLDSDKLCTTLLETDWDKVLDGDIDQATTNFTDVLLSAAAASIPSKKGGQEGGRRDRLFRIAQRTRSDTDWLKWRLQRNHTTALNRRLKDEHTQKQVSKLLSNKKNPHKYHQILKNILGTNTTQTIPPLVGPHGALTTDELEKANALNSHFIQQTQLDTANLTIPQTSTNLPDLTNLDDIQVSAPDVLKILNSLNENKSTGPDKIPTKLLKLTALLIYEPLTRPFNKSLSSGKFPSSWKEANVTAIFKNKGANSEPTNYRPISLLSCISKVLERLVFKKVYAHLTCNNILSDKQSGYRPGHSTQLQLVYLTHKMFLSLDRNEDFTALYLDISKHFDTIWHEGLLYKCRVQCGISGIVLEWLKSYLTDRTQRVRVGDTFSGWQTVKAGCPQGSVLGPLLALIYLNDLSNLTENQILFFADDTSLYTSHPPSSSEHQQSLQRDLDKIKQFGDDWAIQFSTHKTLQQTFSTRQDTQALHLTFGGKQIPTTSNHTHLGLTFSTDLRFHEHVNKIVTRVNRALGPLYPVARFLPRQVLNDIYITYIRPLLDYCDIVYDGHLKTSDRLRLQKLQNRAARLVTGALYRSPTDKLHKDLGWETLETRRLTHRLTFFYRLCNPMLPTPTYMTDLITPTRQDATQRTLRNSSLLSLPKNRLSCFQRSFIPETTRSWNALPEHIRQARTTSSFSKNVRKHFVPQPPPFFSFGSKLGNTLHTRLRLHMSTLNAHLFMTHNSPSTLDAACQCGHPWEDTHHFILHCPLYSDQRTSLYNSVSTMIYNFDALSSKKQLEILLEGHGIGGDGGGELARVIQNFITGTGRFA